MSVIGRRAEPSKWAGPKTLPCMPAICFETRTLVQEGEALGGAKEWQQRSRLGLGWVIHAAQALVHAMGHHLDLWDFLGRGVACGEMCVHVWRVAADVRRLGAVKRWAGWRVRAGP